MFYKHGRIPGSMNRTGQIIAISLMLIALITIVVLAVRGYNAVKSVFTPKVERVEVEVVKEVPVTKYVEKEVVISGETIQSGIREMGKLCTAEYFFTHVSSFEQSSKLNTETQIPGTNIIFPDITIPGTTKTFVYSYDGSIKAGVDFTGIIIEKDDAKRTISVTIPEPEIISSSVDPDSFKLYDEKAGLFSRIKVTDVTDSFASLIKDEEQKARDKGILTQAQDNAKNLIENFIRNTYGVQGFDVAVKIRLR
ncbi:MAG: DUF4230 domain-containing protein [Firmicutes bacterium]|nr:DUF4230 domain-containing protein [Bacillota bacterium]